MGYHQAGFTDIVGIDIDPQPNYPFAFIQADALDLPVDLDAFDLIHASPPCQAYSSATPTEHDHPDLVVPTRDLIAGRPSVIENVPGAPLDGYLRLCGSMFGLDIQRHRYFEMTFPAMSPACNHRDWSRGRAVTITGHFGISGQDGSRHSIEPYGLTDARRLMGIPWMSRAEIVEAIPPAYTEYIGQAFIDQYRNTGEEPTGATEDDTHMSIYRQEVNG